MANEIKETYGLVYANGNQKITIPTETRSITQTNATRLSKTLALTTTEADIDLTGITLPAHIYLRNISSTGEVYYGPKNASNVMENFGTIKPNEVARVRLRSGVTLRMVTSAGTVNVQLEALSD